LDGAGTDTGKLSVKPKRFERVSTIWKPKIVLPGGEGSGGVLI
jgi:hypothetical protein